MKLSCWFCRIPLVYVASIGVSGGLSSLFGQALQDSTRIPISEIDGNQEILLEQIETESDRSELLDRLNWLQDHPFDLNTVTREELSSLPLLTPSEVDAIVRMRKMVKRFSSIDQLLLIEGFGADIFRKVRLYVTVFQSTGGSQEITSVNLRTRVVQDLQHRRGFDDGSFFGSPVKSYSRLSIRHSEQLQAGGLFEKDAGERTDDGFVSGYFAVRDVSFLSSAVVGDYVLEAGQGLVFWRASAFSKGGEAVSVVRKSGGGPQPYRSTDETNFFRGVAISSNIDMGKDRLTAIALYSRRSLNATGNDSSVSSFNADGLFRTQSELLKRGSVDEKIVGGRLQFDSGESWRIGTTWYYSTFSKEIVRNRLYEFGGRSTSVGGVDAEVNMGWLTPRLSQITLFGEAARSVNAAYAGIIGSILNLNRGTSVAIIYRDYSPDFVAIHAAGFGERGETKNERGLYFGVDIRMTNFIRLVGYIDHFKFPWRTFDNPLPASGRDVLLQVTAKPFPRTEVTLRYANKTTETTEASLDELSRETRILTDRTQQKLRFTIGYQASRKFRLRGRIETTRVDYASVHPREQGWLFFQDFQYAPQDWLAVEARVIFFHTKSYDSRVYEFENDVRGVFSNPALYGKGRRWYVLMRWTIAEFLNFSAKYAETAKEGVNTISSGLNEIRGDMENRIALQVELRY